MNPSLPDSSGMSGATYSGKLEALRGLAALMVVGYHAFPSYDYFWIHVPFNGRAAVSLFFVLSGYVLGLSLRRGTGTLVRQYLFFMGRRVFRIYPAYFVTGLVFWAYWRFYPFNGAAGSLMQFASLQLSPLTQLKNFLFLNDFLNPVTWSLKVEMVGSLALPFLHFLSRKWRWSGRLALFVALILWGFADSSGFSRQRLYMFYLGYLIVDLEKLPKLAPRNYSVLTGFCLVPFFTAVLLGESFWNWRLGLLLEAFAAGGIILCLQAGGGSLGGLLDHAWARFAGRVSFSVFLVHLVILDGVVNLMRLSPLKGMLQLGWGFGFYSLGLVISLPVVLLVAWGLYRWVEKPFMDRSKVLFPSNG